VFHLFCLIYQDDYRRNQAFAQVLALKMRKRCWQNNDKGKIIDFEQGQKKFTRASSPVGQGKVQKPHPKKLVLAELVPRDTFGFESVFQIEKTTEMNHLTGTIGHPVNRVSLVAKTSVVLLFIPKRDFFLFTTYKTRKLMRTKLMNPQLGNVCHGVVVGLFFFWKSVFCGLKRVRVHLGLIFVVLHIPKLPSGIFQDYLKTPRMRLNNKKYGTRTKHRSRKNLNNVTRCMLWVGCRKWGLKTPDLMYSIGFTGTTGLWYR
jgi:hypothetical protein